MNSYSHTPLHREKVFGCANETGCTSWCEVNKSDGLRSANNKKSRDGERRKRGEEEEEEDEDDEEEEEKKEQCAHHLESTPSKLILAKTEVTVTGLLLHSSLLIIHEHSNVHLTPCIKRFSNGGK